MPAIRFVAATYNLWGSHRWPEREEALRGFLRALRPDILCVQEFRPALQAVLDQELSGHRRVDDPFEGWIREGNVYWSERLFEMLGYGAEDIGILEPLRRLFWVRLRVKGTERTLLVATAHYTWTGHAQEVATHYNPRVEQAERTVAALDRIAGPKEPLLFMGDLNEANNAIAALRRGGLIDCWHGKETYPVPTHPAFPTATGTPQVLDWQLYRGPVRPLVCEVIDYAKGYIAPSDHKPLVVAYELCEEG